MFSKRTNQWNVPYNVYNPVAEKRRDMENDAAIYKRWRKEQDQKKSEKSQKNPRIPIDIGRVGRGACFAFTVSGEASGSKGRTEDKLHERCGRSKILNFF